MAFPHLGTPWTLDLLFPVDPHIRSTCSGRGGPTACASPRFFETPHCRLSSGVPAKRFVSPASPSPGSTVLNLDRAKRAQNEETTCCVVTSPGPRVRAQAPPETPAPPLCPQRPRPGADFARRAHALPTMHRILAGPPYGWAQLLLGTKTPSETHKAPADTP